MYILPSMLNVQQLYYRRDILEKAGISTEQPKTWAELLDRVKEIKAKTGSYGLLFPAGVTWGGGAFGEGFQHLIVGTSTPQIANDDGTLNLTGEGVKDAFGFYADLINNDLMPIEPLLGPEPWVIPKYEMFPAGKLVATTCGSWCYIYDWGPESKNPIPNITDAVGTWATPGKDGGQYVLVDVDSPWAVNAKAANVDLAKKVLLEIGSVKADVAYAERLGNIPGRKDAAADPDFQKLKALVPVLAGRRQRHVPEDDHGLLGGRRGRGARDRSAAPQADRCGRRPEDPRRLRQGRSRRRSRQVNLPPKGA